MVGIEGPLLPPRLFLPLEFSSRLILIIESQSSSGPSPPLLPSGQDSAPPVPPRVLRPAALPAETDSTTPPAWRPPAAPLLPFRAPPTSPPPDRYSLCACLPH